MKRHRTMWMYAAGALVSVALLRFIEYPDSLFACLSVTLAIKIVSSLLRMCDRLLDAPHAIFLIFSGRKNSFKCGSRRPDLDAQPNQQ